jgi:signal transduction histidine kinase
VRNGRGEPVRVIGAIMDISELRSSEEAQRLLAQASATFESALEPDVTARTLARIGIPELADVCMVDLVHADGTLHRFAVAHIDPAREQFLGLGTSKPLDADADADSAPLRVIRQGTSEFGGDASGSSDRILGAGDGAGISSYAVIPITARGKVLGTVTFGLTDKRRHFGTLAILTAKDLAKRAGMALDNAMLYETVRRAVRDRNEVLGIVSHDLRVPINVIGSALSLLRKVMPNGQSEPSKLFDVLDRATLQMTGLIEDLLDASRLESDQFILDRNSVNAGRIIEEACDMLRVLASSKQIAINTHIAADIPPFKGDAAKLGRVIGNLLENAIKYSPRSATIEVSAQVVEGELHVCVDDHGDGIPEDQMSHVFDRFWSGRGASQRGSGLGLAIARGIVDAHGGRIWTESVIGKGSTFTFALPLV